MENFIDLNEIIDFDDDPVVDPQNDPTPDDGGNNDPDSTPVDDPHPLVDEPVIEEPTPPTNEPTTEPEEEIDPETLKGYYNFLNEFGIISKEEGEEFEGTVEAFEAAITKSKEKLIESAYEQVFNRLPEDVKAVVEYGLRGGSVEDFIKASTPVDYDSLDMDDVDTQRQVVFDYYKSTSTWSDDKILKFIDTLEKDSDFKAEAEDALNDLKELSAKKQQQLLERQQQDIEDQQRKAEEEAARLAKLIDDNSQFEGLRKNRLKTFILNPIKTDSGVTTEFDNTLTKIFSNPEHFVQLADILADYHPSKGFNFDKLKNQLKSSSTRGIRQTLQSALDTKGGKQQPPSREDFDWEEYTSFS